MKPVHLIRTALQSVAVVAALLAGATRSQAYDITPGADPVPALPAPYAGMVNVLLPSVTPGVTTATSDGTFDGAATWYWSPANNPLPTTNPLNNGTVPAGAWAGLSDELSFIGQTGGKQCAAFSGLSADIQYIRIWGENFDRTLNNITVRSSTSILTGADLLNPAKYETVALASTAVAYNITPFSSYGNGQTKGEGFAITTAANTKSIMFDFGSQGNGPRIFEIQAFGSLYVPTPPPVPTGLVAQAADTLVALSWTGSSEATSYNVLRSTTDGSGYASIATPSTTTYQDTTVTNGNTYYYVVQAVNDVGPSGNSNQATASPNPAAKLDQTIAFALGATLNKTVGDAPFADTATATSGLAVSYSSSNEAVATVDPASGLVTIVAVGTTEIRANQAGNGSFNAAPQVAQVLTVKDNQTLAFTLGTTLTKRLGDAAFEDTATATSGLAVSYSSSNETVATVDSASGVVTLIAQGTAEIRANQAGDASFNAAPQLAQTLTVGPPLHDITPGAVPVPDLPVPYAGMVNVLLPSVTPGVTTATSHNSFDNVTWYADPANLLLPTTNPLNNGTVPAGAEDGVEVLNFIGQSGGIQCAAFSGLSANIQYIRIWGENGDRKLDNITVRTTTSILTGADLLNPAKYETVALASTAVAYDITPFPYQGGYGGADVSTKGEGFAITTAANTKSIMFDFGSQSNGPRLFEIQAFASTVPLVATTTAVTGNGTSKVNDLVTFTATVSATPTAPTSGTVQFYDNTAPLGSASVNSSGVATFGTTALTVGTHSITAHFNANTVFDGSDSPEVIQIVNPLRTAYELWSDRITNGKTGPNEDADADGVPNFIEFAFNGDPMSAASTGMVHALTEYSVPHSGKVLVLTIAVRKGTGTPAEWAANNYTGTVDGITYTIEGGTTLGDFDSAVGKIFVCETAITTGLTPTPTPDVENQYEWRSFILESSAGLGTKGFLRARVEQ